MNPTTSVCFHSVPPDIAWHSSLPGFEWRAMVVFGVPGLWHARRRRYWSAAAWLLAVGSLYASVVLIPAGLVMHCFAIQDAVRRASGARGGGEPDGLPSWSWMLSWLCPGLAQGLQGRYAMALVWMLGVLALYLLMPLAGCGVHLVCLWDAWRGQRQRPGKIHA